MASEKERDLLADEAKALTSSGRAKGSQAAEKAISKFKNRSKTPRSVTFVAYAPGAAFRLNRLRQALRVFFDKHPEIAEIARKEFPEEILAELQGDLRDRHHRSAVQGPSGR